MICERESKIKQKIPELEDHYRHGQLTFPVLVDKADELYAQAQLVPGTIKKMVILDVKGQYWSNTISKIYLTQ